MSRHLARVAVIAALLGVGFGAAAIFTIVTQPTAPQPMTPEEKFVTFLADGTENGSVVWVPLDSMISQLDFPFVANLKDNTQVMLSFERPTGKISSLYCYRVEGECRVEEIHSWNTFGDLNKTERRAIKRIETVMAPKVTPYTVEDPLSKHLPALEKQVTVREKIER